jgi:cytochrome c-type biogenesis protein
MVPSTDANLFTLNYLSAFLAGVAVSFTPCVYPLLPVSMAYIGVTSAKTRLRGFFLSAIYVTGIAVTYSILGLIASMTGSIFGMISTHPLTYLIIGIVVIVFGLSMFDFFSLALPFKMKLAQGKERSFISVFFLGMASGFVIGPCLTPVLGSILVYLATKQNILFGTTLLVVFAYGMGLSLMLASLFSSFLTNLPKAGKWLDWIKRVGGLVLIGMGVYFIVSAWRRFTG